MTKKRRIGLILLVGMLCVSKITHAAVELPTQVVESTQQAASLTGVVEDDIAPVIGASVVIKGTTNGTITDVNGKFMLSNLKKGDIIQVSFIGYVMQEIEYNGQTSLTVRLLEDSRLLDEVVVTALGIKRETKSLGYSMQEMKGDALLESRESNVLNALSGKVAGLQVLRSSNGVGGSTKIVLRGSSSLTGSNQPLIVIDGIPMDNFTGGVDDTYGNNGMDMGSGLADINQEDIESMSVLKGASAAALYGSRAGNGVILITTKSGTERPGVGITINSGVSIETPFIKPEMQNSFGQGTNGNYENQSKFTWGPKITGQTVKDWSGKNDVSLAAYDNYDSFFRTGVSFNEGVSFQQNINGTSVFASLNRSDDNGTTPESSLARTAVNVRATAFLDKEKKWQIDAKANYINTDAKNRPTLGLNPSNAYNTIYSLPVSIDMGQFKHNMYDEVGRMLWWSDDKTPQDNPFWSTKNRLNNDKRDRLLGALKLKFAPTDWLNMEVSGGTDYYTTRMTEKTHAGSPNADGGGRYSENKETFYENNYSFLAVAKKDNVFSKLSGSITAGGNLMFQGREKIEASAGKLLVDNYFTLNNGINPPSIKSTNIKRRMNSMYGVVNLNWDNYLYFDVTARNDWSSTLSKDNNSYFYPSFNLSYLMTEMFDKHNISLPKWISFLKLRGSYAVVGNDLDPYKLYNVFKMEKNSLGYNLIRPNETQFDSTLKSELSKSWEAGLDIRFLDGRLGLDATWYKKNTTNQLLDIPTHPFSGYGKKIVNAGNVQNQGIELALTADIIQNAKGLGWNTTVNFSHNKDKILELADGISIYQLHERDLQNIQIVAEAGGEYGAIYGRKYRRVDDVNSPHHGKVIVDGEGLPLFTADKEYLGNQSPKALIGITNNFTYKGFNLSFLVDMRLGGKIYSGTTAVMNTYGLGKSTVVNGERQNFVIPNSVISKDGQYEDNILAVTPEKYWSRLGSSSAGGNFGLGEEYTYDATNIRLRNITLGYNLDKKILRQTPFQRVRLSATCNNVWMIHSKLDGIDPESVTATNTNASGFEANSAPTSRTFVFNLTIGF